MCRGPALGLELLPGVGGGVGSTAFLNTLAGFNLAWRASAVTHWKIYPELLSPSTRW